MDTTDTTPNSSPNSFTSTGGAVITNGQVTTPAPNPSGSPATSISADGLTPDPALSTVTPQSDPIISQGNSIINGALASIPTTQATVTQGETGAENDISQISTLEGQDANKSADTLTENESQGVNAYNDQLNNYNAQLDNINAQVSGLADTAKEIPLQKEENFAGTMTDINGVNNNSAGDLRTNAINSLKLSALADVLTSNIKGTTDLLANATAKVTQAIALKYDPIETEIANLKDQLQMNAQYVTDPAEAKLVQEQTTVLNARSEALATQKADETTAQTTKLQILSNYGNSLPSSVMTALNGATTLADVLNIKGIAPYLTQGSYSHFTDPNTGVTNIYDTKTGKVVGTYGSSSTDVNTNTSSASLPATQYTLKSGDDPYNIAQNAGTNMDTLKQLNPSITDWTKLPVGTVLNMPPAQSTTAPYTEYGLLSNTNFNPNNTTDQNAKLYLNQYLQGTMPTTRSMGLSTSKGAQQTFAQISARASDLYSTATGNPLPPDPQILKGYVDIIIGNNKIANNLNVQNGAITKNFGLNLQNATTNNINQNAPQILNSVFNSLNAFFSDPATLQYYMQNSTISQEAGNLLAVRNATGTTVYDKMVGAGLIPRDASTTAQAQMMKTLLQEAQNVSQTINSTNASLYKITDPLQLDSNNPNRQTALNGGTNPADDQSAVTTFGQASTQNYSVLKQLSTQFPNATPTQIRQTLQKLGFTI